MKLFPIIFFISLNNCDDTLEKPTIAVI